MKDTTTERVGRYQLLEPIGTGPCGTVSRAKVYGVAGFERQFAVKRFHPELTITSALAQALSTAARAYGSLEHPRIARMSEFGVAQGQTFTAVELIPGLDALRLVSEVRATGATLAAGGALALISQAARAVGYAHGRGLVHLGLAPTNVIVTAEGDIKITDFAVLAAGMPARPVDVARLAQRIQYLAPEQIAGEATSAATDVFSLGVIAYELITGQRTFRGETPQQVAQAILGGPPAEPSLPRPIVRVLQRCLARSPFERFPDARALADALDASLRVAPVPGTRKDVGALVKSTMERIAALHSGELSGMLALHIGAGAIRRDEPVQEIATLGRESHRELATSEFVRPDTHVAGPSPLIGPANTLPDLPRPMTTVTGLPPPPIAVPPGVSPPPPPPLGPAGVASTLLGIPKVVSVPQIKVRPSGEIPDVAARAPAEATRPPSMPVVPTRFDTESPTEVRAPERELLFPDERATLDMSMHVEDDSLTVRGTSTILGQAPPSHELVHEVSPPSAAGISGVEPRATEVRRPSGRSSAPETLGISAPLPTTTGDGDGDGSDVPDAAPRRRRSSLAVNEETRAQLELDKPGRRRGFAIAAVLGAGALGIGGWLLYQTVGKPSASRGADSIAVKPVESDGGALATATADARSTAPDGLAVVTVPLDSAQVATTSPDATQVATTPPDATQVATTPPDATRVAEVPADATLAKPAPDPTVATGASDTLSISSKPAGAHVFLDGSDSGVTPLKLPGSADRHTIALLLPGHDLYIAEVDGHGAFSIPLNEVTPSAGPAGIKIIRCKDKDRYYVFVDGKATGQMCPTERIETDVGAHTVEVYDAGTESRKKWDIVVKDTRLSYRVKIE